MLFDVCKPPISTSFQITHSDEKGVGTPVGEQSWRDWMLGWMVGCWLRLVIYNRHYSFPHLKAVLQVFWVATKHRLKDSFGTLLLSCLWEDGFLLLRWSDLTSILTNTPPPRIHNHANQWEHDPKLGKETSLVWFWFHIPFCTEPIMRERVLLRLESNFGIPQNAQPWSADDLQAPFQDWTWVPNCFGFGVNLSCTWVAEILLWKGHRRWITLSGWHSFPVNFCYITDSHLLYKLYWYTDIPKVSQSVFY